MPPINFPVVKKRTGPKSNYQKMKEAKAAAKAAASMTPEVEREMIIQELARRKGKRDLIYLLEDILDYPKFGDVHREVETQLKEIENNTGKGLLLLPRGHLKAQPLDTKIPTPTGFRIIGDLSIGDRIFGADGNPVKVTHLHPISEMDIFELTTRDGKKTRCNKEHLWQVICPSNRGKEKFVLPLKDFLDRYKTPRVDYRTETAYDECRFFLPACDPLEYQEKVLPIDPYRLGAWLGDGTSASGEITIHDNDVEILERMGSYRKLSAKYRYVVEGLRKELKLHGLIKNKHVPEIYFTGSINQRIKLLQGLLDTDGTVQQNGRVASFTNKNESLVDAVVELTRSLGGIAKKGFTINKQFHPEGVIYHSVTIMLPKEMNPFSLRRKRDKFIGSRSLKTAITDIRYVGKEQARCITIENSDGLYITQDYLVTHNSTVVTIAWVIQQIIKNPDNRILITSGYLENSKNFLREIKGHFEKSEKLKTLYGEFVERDGKWSENQIVVKQRKRVRKEPTIQASSIDKSQVSQHYDIIVGDDIVNRENINTKELRHKVLNYYRDLYDLLEPGGILILIGTRWHFDDLYGHIIQDQKNNKKFTIVKKSCWLDEERTLPLFPEKFKRDHLNQLRKDKGSFEFSAQYLNEPVDDENADFDRNWVKKKTQEEMMAQQLAIYITIDPAMSKNETADFSGFTVNGVDAQGNWNILRAYRRKLNPAELIDEIFFLHSRYRDKMRSMGIEKTQYVVGLKESISSEMMKRGQIFDIVEVNHRGRNKETRIRALTPLLESGRIIFSEYCNDVLEEMLSFPRSKNDDVLDSLAYQIDLVPTMVQFGANEIVQGKKIQVLKPRFQSYGGSRKPNTIWR